MLRELLGAVASLPLSVVLVLFGVSAATGWTVHVAVKLSEQPQRLDDASVQQHDHFTQALKEAIER